MAHRLTGYGKSILVQQNSRSFSTSTTHDGRKLWGKPLADWAPIGIVLGFVMIASGVGVRTGWQQLVHNPNVYLYKSKREMIPELDKPTEAVKSGGKYVDKSLLRKIAHIQDDSKNTIPNPVKGNIYTRRLDVQTNQDALILSPSRHADTLDSIKD